MDGWNSPNSNLRISAVYEYLNTSIAPVYRYDTALPACTMLLAMCTNGPQFGTREIQNKAYECFLQYRHALSFF